MNFLVVLPQIDSHLFGEEFVFVQPLAFRFNEHSWR